ncbi:unnamed protein product [Ostreobium quekettii]|uniref:Glycosyltransferase family 92 protein n=1 Tax=Ostreobium quekettii TaxID=121088 RepID=A0A8S1J5D0_9CHLO|nr:unnamed protein product [Ostreobium quekettii]|eukprot:evm.model.scf_55.5 EVM.evm.TU.scf_55.5   scf_55:113723-118568(+)
MLPAASSRAAGSPSPIVRLLVLLPLLLAAFCLLLQAQRRSPDVALGLTGGRDGGLRLRNEPSLEDSLGGGKGKTRQAGMGTAQNVVNSNALPNGAKKQGAKLAIATTTAAGVDSIKVWMRYHKSIGFSMFYLFLNGQVNHDAAIWELGRWSGVKLFPNNERLQHRHAHSRAWNETWLSAFFNKPCNNELFVMQSLNMEVAIQQAMEDGVDWIFHLDTDELLYPGGTGSFSIQEYMDSLDDDIDSVVFPNYEGLAERDDVTDPFTEVTLFKRNFAHVNSDEYFKKYSIVARGNPNYFTTYGNGKSAGRIQPHLRSNGAHRWYIYGKKPKEITSTEPTVLHYVYNKYADLKGRRDRCDCAPTDEDVKRCFILPFDREAFLASSLKDDKELRQYFRDKLVWSDRSQVKDLLKGGLFVRIHVPQVMTQMYRKMPDAGLILAGPEESKVTVMDAYQMPEESNEHLNVQVHSS